MASQPFIGQTLIIHTYPAQVTAIAAHSYIADELVIMAKGDLTGYVVIESDKFASRVTSPTYHASGEEATRDFLSRAFGM